MLVFRQEVEKTFLQFMRAQCDKEPAYIILKKNNQG